MLRGIDGESYFREDGQVEYSSRARDVLPVVPNADPRILDNRMVVWIEERLFSVGHGKAKLYVGESLLDESEGAPRSWSAAYRTKAVEWNI